MYLFWNWNTNLLVASEIWNLSDLLRYVTLSPVPVSECPHPISLSPAPSHSAPPPSHSAPPPSHSALSLPHSAPPTSHSAPPHLTQPRPHLAQPCSHSIQSVLFQSSPLILETIFSSPSWFSHTSSSSPSVEERANVPWYNPHTSTKQHYTIIPCAPQHPTSVGGHYWQVINSSNPSTQTHNMRKRCEYKQ